MPSSNKCLCPNKRLVKYPNMRNKRPVPNKCLGVAPASTRVMTSMACTGKRSFRKIVQKK